MKKSKSLKLKPKPKKTKSSAPTTTNLTPPAVGPMLTPPTAGTCSSCFYGQTFAQSGGDRLCRVAHSNSVAPAPGRWVTVRDDDWCGEGKDNTSYASFSPVVMDQTSGAAEPVWIAPNPNPGSTLSHIVGTAAAQSVLIRSGPGWITGISVNSVATGSATLTCYDGTDATGTVIAVIDISKGNPSPQTAAPWGFQTGFFVVVSNGSAGADITIVSHST
jgi:hypothetical protein